MVSHIPAVLQINRPHAGDGRSSRRRPACDGPPQTPTEEWCTYAHPH